MTTITLRHLEERLQQEAPELTWTCEPIGGVSIERCGLPERVQVLAMRQGLPVKGSPFYLSGASLLRWGVDRSVALICNELAPVLHGAQNRMGMEWDRLAEI
jgi:hypothetical protein